MKRTFIREIPLDRFTKEMEEDFTKRGFEIVLTENNSVEIYAV